MDLELEDFKTEILETLERAEHALLRFDELEENQGSFDLYDEVFRAYHNIKGAAGMMEWDELQHHVHELENVLMQFKESSSIPRHLISWFLKGHDVTRMILNHESYDFDYTLPKSISRHITKGENEVTAAQKRDDDHFEEEHLTKEGSLIEKDEVQSLPDEFLPEMNEALDKISETLLKLEKFSRDQQLIDSLYREIHSIKGAVQLFNLKYASQLSHAMENSLELYRENTSFELEKAHVSTLLLCVDLMNSCITSPNDEQVGKELQFMLGLLGPFSTNPQMTENKNSLNNTNKKNEIDKKNESKVPHVMKKNESDKSDSSIRVQVSLLDRLMTLMGEMVLVRNQVLQYSSRSDDLELLNLSQKLDVVTSELQEETMKTRMQPIGNVLNKFQRVVRDLAENLDKKITINLYGVETELDKTLIEAIKDPLTHIVRNSCDHGIETPQMRLSKGKSETGNITIKAFHEGGQVIVDISDDGKGLSREYLTSKAIDKGIIDSYRAEKMSDREVFSLIFAPGFSTADKVTNVSGRGVGMDVVKSNIEKIGGMVDICSTEGEGTTITLKIPLTLAIVPAMIVKSEEDRFAIPQVKLVELVRVERENIEFVQGRAVYRLRGNILPLIDLKEVLNTEKDFDEDEQIHIIVLSSDTHVFGLIVDEILDTADIVVKPLAKFLKSISIYSGATVLGDGSVAFILDVQGIAQKFLGHETMDVQTVSDKYAEYVNNELEVREYVLIGLDTPSKHAVPLSLVSRMEEIPTDSIEMSGPQKVIRYRGGILKILNLNNILGYSNHVEEKSEITQLIVVKYEESYFGIEVNSIIDVCSTKDYLDSSVKSHEYISGNLVTNDEIVVVVDVEKICRDLNPPSETFKVSDKIDGPLPRVLLVEDTESIRNKVCANLKRSGYEVFPAVDGVDGLKKIADQKGLFDVIVSDIEMPRMNGIEFARKVSKIKTLKNIPLVAYTAKNSPADIQEAKDAGFLSFVEKSKGNILPLIIAEYLTSHKKESA